MSKTYPCCVANAAGAACACGMSDENVLLREIRKLSGAVKQAERERDEATAERDRLAGLLRDANDELERWDDGKVGRRNFTLHERIDAALAEVGK